MTLITNEVLLKIDKVLSITETGKPDGDYGALVVMNDGAGRSPQITYGKHQTTEQGNLKKLIALYIDMDGKYAVNFMDYLPKIGNVPLHKDMVFRDLLITAGDSDPIMRKAQDHFFKKLYFDPAFSFFLRNQFTLPLSLLVLYDSYIHSGGILEVLRNKFAELVPSKGGDEKAWIKAYVSVRHGWLSSHSNKLVRNSRYRTNLFKNLIIMDNWLLDKKFNYRGFKL